MKTSDFFYELPPSLIAQTPVEPRDSARLLRMDRETGELSHWHFYDLPKLLRPGDLLVVNNSRVLPARLYGCRSDTGAPIEILLLEQVGHNRWDAIVKPGKKLKVGAPISFGEGLLTGVIDEVSPDGNRIIQFDPALNLFPLLEQLGQMPLPPYITEKLQDKERYQTVYSRDLGSAAAPTAGLHFTEELLQTLRNMGVGITQVTLHVGLGTFRPVKVEDVTAHHMHSEHFSLSEEAADAINRTKAEGGRVICVGTTSCRTVESAAQRCGDVLEPCEGYTDIFIYPGYKFQVMDGLITNFHLPESTLIMLVSAFCGKEHTLKAYETAVKEEYRFFSFGDANLIL